MKTEYIDTSGTVAYTTTGKLIREEKIHCTNCELSYFEYLFGLQCRFFQKSYVWFLKGNSCARRNKNLDCKHFVDKRKGAG